MKKLIGRVVYAVTLASVASVFAVLYLIATLTVPDEPNKRE